MILQFKKYSKILLSQANILHYWRFSPSIWSMKASVVFASGCPKGWKWLGQIFMGDIWLAVAKMLCFGHKLDMPKRCSASLLTIHCVQNPRSISVASN